MRRKLDLAMSLICNPSVIFLDEPTTGLDPQSRKAMWESIKDLSHSGVTVFLTTQYLDEADELADQIAILNDGKIVAEGTASELKKLITHRHIELKIHHKEAVQMACNLLDEYTPSTSEENQTLTISTDGSIKQITSILNLLENADITVAEFSQKLPTLEDVPIYKINIYIRGDLMVINNLLEICLNMHYKIRKEFAKLLNISKKLKKSHL
nr:AAA family ATPase [Clostridium algoriphilum]